LFGAGLSEAARLGILLLISHWYIVEASKRFADAWSHHAESPEVVAGLYSAIERMRRRPLTLSSSLPNG
jgi:hypothetical protein